MGMFRGKLIVESQCERDMHEWLLLGVGCLLPWIEAVGIARVMWSVFEGLLLLVQRT